MTKAKLGGYLAIDITVKEACCCLFSPAQISRGTDYQYYHHQRASKMAGWNA